MSRPSDWWVLDLGRDPVPGDAFAVRSLARAWSGLADDAEWAETRVRQLIGDGAIGAWIGEAGDAFRAKTGDLPEQLGQCKASYRLAADALDWWAGRLVTHQADADAALVRGRAARQELEAAQAAAASATAALDAAAGSRVLTDPSLAPTPEQVREARQRHASAQSAASSADAAVADAQARLDAARQLALDAASLRDGDARVAADRIHEASDAGIPERSRWEKFKDWAAEAWDVVVTIAKVVVAVLGVVALIIGGPLAWVVFAAALLVLADTIMKYMQDQASLWDVAFAALACIPGTKGLTTLSALNNAFRTGGALGALGHVGNAMRQAGIQMARSANALRHGFGPGMRASFRVLGKPRGLNSWASVRTTVGEAFQAFEKAKGAAWTEYVDSVTDPVKKARLWQGAQAYPGVDRYRPTTLSPGTRLEVGSPGLSGYTLPEGTAAAAGGDAPTVWERAQVGPGAPGSLHPGYRDSMLILEVVGEDVSAATGVAKANPQYGGGGSTQHFIPDLRERIIAGDIAVLDASGVRLDIPPATTPGDLEGVIRSGLGGDAGTIHLTGAQSPQPYVNTLKEVAGWSVPSPHFREALRAIGYDGMLGREMTRD